MGRVEKMRERWLPLLVVLTMLLTFATFTSAPRARASSSQSAFENCLLDGVNEARGAQGMDPIEMASDLVPDVREWSEWMRFNDFEHMPSSRRDEILPDTWTTWAENIAMHGDDGMSDCAPIHNMWMNSPGHRANILNPSFHFVAIGAYVDGSGWWATQLFFDATGYPETCVGLFCDDDGSTYESDIESIATAGITSGCNPPANTDFCPDEYVTRGQMAAFLARALDLPPGSADFADDNGSIYEADIARIATAGITSGCNPPANTDFCPDEYVTRGQMAAFLARALGL
jgi:uncharacterized protein YkwD